MKIFKRTLILFIIMLTIFLAGCKKCGKNKDESGDGGNGGGSAGTSIPVDASGNLNYNKPSKSNLSGNRKEVVFECLKLYHTFNTPNKSVETITSYAQEELDEYSQNEEEFTEDTSYLIENLENSSITLEQIKSLSKLVLDNKQLIIYGIDWYEDGDTTIFDESNYEQAKSVLKTLKNMFTIEQIGMALAYGECGYELGNYEDCAFDNLYGESIVKTFSELTSMYNGKITFAESKRYFDDFFQLYTAGAALSYRVIDILLETDSATVKQAAKAFRYIESENYESLAINLKDNINSAVSIVKKVLNKISDDEIKTILNQDLIKNEGEHLCDCIYLEDYRIPVSLSNSDWYLARPLATLAVNVLSDEKVVDKICEYAETLVDKYSDNVAMNLGMYVAEQVIAGYEKLSKKDKQMLEECVSKLLPSTFEYSIEDLLDTVKPILNNSDYDNEEKLEEFARQISNDIEEADKGGVYATPCYSTYDYLIVEKGTTKDNFKNRIGNYYYVWYSEGNGYYEDITYSKYRDMWTIKSFDTSTVGFQKATLSYNSYEFEIEYYVRDYYKNLPIKVDSYVPNLTCYVVQGQPNVVLSNNDYGNISFDIHYYIEELERSVYKDYYVNVSDVTLYDIDASYLHSGLGYAVIKTDDTNGGEIKIPVNYHVLPKDERITPYISVFFSSNIFNYENITKQVLLENVWYFGVNYIKAVQDEYGDYTKYDSGYEYAELTAENITNITIYDEYVEVEITYGSLVETVRIYRY